MVVNSSDDPNRTYSNIFRTYIVRNAEFTLKRIQKYKIKIHIYICKLPNIIRHDLFTVKIRLYRHLKGMKNKSIRFA